MMYGQKNIKLETFEVQHNNNKFTYFVNYWKHNGEVSPRKRKEGRTKVNKWVNSKYRSKSFERYDACPESKDTSRVGW